MLTTVRQFAFMRAVFSLDQPPLLVQPTFDRLKYLSSKVVHIQLQPPRDGKEQGPTMADRVTIRSAESKLIVERGRIARVATKEK